MKNVIMKLLSATLRILKRKQKREQRDLAIPSEDDRELFIQIDSWFRAEKAFLRDNISLEDVAAALCTNRNYVSRSIRSFSGKSFPEYLNAYRIEYAMAAARKNPSLRVTDMAHIANYKYTTTFSQAFCRYMDMQPSVWLADLRAQRSKQLRAYEPKK